MPDIKQFLSRRYLRLVDNLSESFLLSQSITTDWKTQRLLELMEQITLTYRTFLLRKRRTCFTNCALSETVARSSIHS